jgi:hypothetical protein
MLWHHRTHATTLTRLGITPRRCSTDSPGRPSLPLCNTVWWGRCQPRDTAPPTPVWLTHRALEGGRQNPRILFPWLHRATPWRQASGSGLPRRYEPCAAIPATAAPRRAPRRHPRRCWTARGRDAAMTATVPRTDPPLTAPSNWPAAAAGQPTTTPPPSKLLMHEHRTRHDAPTGAGFARTTVSSVALLATPPHVGK